MEIETTILKRTAETFLKLVETFSLFFRYFLPMMVEAVKTAVTIIPCCVH
jgi:hypothetical protein